MMRVALLFLFCCTSAFAQYVNPAVTGDNIYDTICIPGWSAMVRPPVSYTNKVKKQRLQEIGLGMDSSPEYELDHRIPISVGGHPRDLRNLALQEWDGPNGAHAKDVVEARMHRMVCDGKIELRVAQRCLARSWQNCPKE